MPLSPDQLQSLSRWLDELMDLAPAEREAWLARLPADQQDLADTLREMLKAQVSTGGENFLASLPELREQKAAKDSADIAHAGDRVGPYRLIKEIGRGGMGAVWLAERADGNFKRQVALKLPRLAWGSGLAERMAREREIGAMLEHPNIARLYDAGVDELGRPYIAMEYIDGKTIDVYCRDRQLSVRDRLKLLVQVARAVAYAHGRLIVHRDLKPSNVLVSADGNVHLLDFGIAKLLNEAGKQATQEHTLAMTPQYASPEQIQGVAVTVQTDVYSLGVMSYELLAGCAPHAPKRRSLGAMEEVILAGDVLAPSTRAKDDGTRRLLKGDIDAIVGKALKVDPAQRYPTADAMAQDIERHLRQEAVSAQPDSASYRLRKMLRRHWAAFAATSVAMLAVLIGSSVAVVNAQRAAQAAEKERVTKAFVTDLFRNSLPANDGIYASSQADNSPHALTERGAELIEQRFAGQPEMQAELYGVVGNIFSDMGAYGLAARYAQRRLEKLQSIGASNDEIVNALLALGHALDDDRRYAEAEVPARRALELSHDKQTLKAQALSLLAGILIETGSSAEASALLDQAEASLDTLVEPLHAVRAMVLSHRAIIITNMNRFDEGLPIYLQALSVAKLAKGGERSPEAIAIGLMVARQLLATGQEEKAEDFYRAAISALKSQGGVYEARAAVQIGRYAYRRSLIGPEAALGALAELEGSRETLKRLQLPLPPVFIPRLEVWMGGVKARLGDVAGAISLLRNNASLYDQLSGVSDKIEVGRTFATTFLHAGHYEDAHRWLVRKRELVRSLQTNGSGPSDAYFAIEFATGAMMAGRLEEALETIDAAPVSGSIRGAAGARSDLHKRVLDWTRAKIMLAQGASAAAMAVLQRTPPASDEDSESLSDYRRTLGEAQCRSGDIAGGSALLRRQLAEDESRSAYPHAPWLARMRAVVALCVLALGDQKSALALNRQVRESFTIQAEVSEYYKTPWRELEVALARPKPKRPWKR